ncbi:hypothetical protein [Desulfosediminicola flagellatus]|uniref:hypothetical protein n=1 Tax=Desulfosediminicola flagellatus TaxID=2569541 RepID=UPI0010AC1FCB|nr:hypothetical protein [Desulfosediminicola flagellatus]
MTASPVLGELDLGVVARIDSGRTVLKLDGMLPEHSPPAEQTLGRCAGRIQLYGNWPMDKAGEASSGIRKAIDRGEALPFTSDMSSVSRFSSVVIEKLQLHLSTSANDGVSYELSLREVTPASVRIISSPLDVFSSGGHGQDEALTTPVYSVRIASLVFETVSTGGGLADIDIEIVADMEVGLDYATLNLPVSVIRPEPTNPVEIQLGYAGDSNRGTWYGQVSRVSEVASGWSIEVLGELSRLNQTVPIREPFLDAPAGTIIRDVARECGLDVGICNSGVRLARYFIDPRRPAHGQIRDLADLAGGDLFIGEGGRLNFRVGDGYNRCHVIDPKPVLLKIETAEHAAQSDYVEVWGESGDRTWPYLTSDFAPSAGRAGTSGAGHWVESSALRDKLAADIVAHTTYSRSRRRQHRGTMTILGRAGIHLGDAISLRSSPSVTGHMLVRRIHHLMNGETGFVTTVDFEIGGLILEGLV